MTIYCILARINREQQNLNLDCEGINLGDVIEEGDHIYGDGVNIAARIESLAEAGEICISGSAYEHIENKLPLRYEYLGEHTVKNIAKPIRIYKAKMELEAALPAGKEKQPKIRISMWPWTRWLRSWV